MKKSRKKNEKPLTGQVRSPAFRAPMSGAGPHKDHKNEYKRVKNIKPAENAADAAENQL